MLTVVYVNIHNSLKICCHLLISGQDDSTHTTRGYLLVGKENGFTECLLRHFTSQTFNHYWKVEEW